MKTISICIPCYNEEANIKPLLLDLDKELRPLRKKYNFEIIVEDNASTDSSFEELQKLLPVIEGLKVIKNISNYGPMKNGAYIMFQATGDAAIGLPCDGQVPLSLIAEYLYYWEQGFQVVFCQIEKSEEPAFMFRLRSAYYAIMNIFSYHNELAHVTGSGLFDKKVLDIIGRLNEPEPNFRYLVTELGFKYKVIPYIQQNRKYGRSSYSIIAYYNQAVDSFVAVGNKPIRYILNFGVTLTALSFIGLIYITISYQNAGENGLIIFLLAVVIFLLSVIILLIGLIGEYIGDCLKRLKHRPLVIEECRTGFNDKLESK